MVFSMSRSPKHVTEEADEKFGIFNRRSRGEIQRKRLALREKGSKKVGFNGKRY